MIWTWNPATNLANQRKHRLSFEMAQRVFDDPFVLSRRDNNRDEERWISIGMIEELIVVVVHTWRDDDELGSDGRIISARKATKHEQKVYCEGEF
ncbi:MAG: BrnT family toxin [Alphaproteobacteria bacterium]|nr:BrnT family toxin [Alphaproteobacteria bacterium]